MYRYFLLVFVFACRFSYADCNISIPTVSFGIYNPVASSDTMSSSSINVSCSPTTTYTLSLQTGQSGNFTARYLQGSEDKLGYNLYLDSGRNAIFGDGNNNSYNYSGSAPSVPIYGKIPGSQHVQAGSYSDIISLQLSF